MEREVGGGIGMGNTCKPMTVSFQCMTKFTTKKKKKQLNSQLSSCASLFSRHRSASSTQNRAAKDRESIGFCENNGDQQKWAHMGCGRLGIAIGGKVT